jgi:hypothetical protein
MLHGTVLTFGDYLIACGIAWMLHESAHYAVHSVYAKSVSFGVNRRGPYVDAVYEPISRVSASVGVRVVVKSVSGGAL